MQTMRVLLVRLELQSVADEGEGDFQDDFAEAETTRAGCRASESEKYALHKNIKGLLSISLDTV